MEWIKPQYSKGAIRKAGKVLASDHPDDKKSIESFDALSNWRSAHAYPMQAILILLRKTAEKILGNEAEKINKNVLVAQRLKRAPSIVQKLKRECGMQLDRMEDIGGCRAIVSTLSQVKQLSSALRLSKTVYILHRERNYIEEPKPSGYRGIHLIYKYDGTKTEYKNIPIEIQIRSKIQHAWATAVEVAGVFTKSALKASQGSDEWLKYFQYASAELARLEGCSPDPCFNSIDIRSELELLSTTLNVYHQFAAFTITTERITKETKTKNKNSFYLLTLDVQAS
ncbi:RelA/SpoT domain-containing protein [Candidatus Nitrosoglobus terrae]|uniref:RelA/SpoT domain-containing protein n=1 Tax=Candidatus Nitrosoglobus terrae TaxID=1630141 RepID=A0A1Q2SL84_9GAMM|nr:RelA/SpoT domain-containing protein [Candidatus Nitrosoglobus terrae]BAW79863.1 RelA/SpoT domain-containing protein [Candidatus Nitrosoglobus terrae]